MFSFLLQFVLSVEYSLAATKLTISGTGEINQQGVESKGSLLKVTTIIIEEGPDSITDGSFRNCPNVETITIPKSVKSISGQPFSWIGKLSKIIVDKGNENYMTDDNFILYSSDHNLLVRAPTVANLEIPEGVEIINTLAFCGDGFNFGDVIFPSSITTLNYNALYASKFNSVSFRSNSQLSYLSGFGWATIQTLNVPNSVLTIAESAFMYADISFFLFESNSKLETIVKLSFEKAKIPKLILPDSLKTIEDLAFSESKIASLTIGAGCSNFSLSALNGCAQLSEIVVSESNGNYKSDGKTLMNKLGTEIIFIPPSSESIRIPKKVTKIGQTMLQSCNLLKTIDLEEGGDVWSTEKGVLYSKDFTKLIAVCGGITEVTANSKVTEISEFAAYGCKKLVKIVLTNADIKNICNFAFAYTGLKSFDLPDSVTAIGYNTFEFTEKMTTFNMGTESLLTEFPYYSFHGSAIKSFSFGKNIQTIGGGAFYGCTNLKSIEFPEGSKIDTINSYAFEASGLVNVVLPSTIKTLMSRCFRICGHLETFTISENSQLTTITEIDFEGCTRLWKVVLPNSCTTIEGKAFYQCTSLTSITHHISTIGNMAFSECTSLTSFNFSATQTDVNPGMFLNCDNLISFTVDESNSVLKDYKGIVYSRDQKILYLFPPGQETAKIPPITEKFSDNAFAWSPKLKFVAFYSGSNLETIGIETFYDCKKLTTVQFPTKLITLKGNCFYGCSSLKSILLPSTLETIEEGAFSGCSRLKSVKYCGTNEITGEKVFDHPVNVLVTELYPSQTFCANDVYPKLSYDCELKEEYLQTCGTQIHIQSFFTLLTVILSVNYNI